MEARELPMVPEQIDGHSPMVQLHRSTVHKECSILGTMNLCYTPMGGLEEGHGTASVVHGT